MKKQRRTQAKGRRGSAGGFRVAAAILLCLAVAVTFFLKNGKAPNEAELRQDVQTVSPGESLVIPVSEISGTARFYPVVVDGTEMEIIAVEDAEGSIRTAFNTCQICYSSGRGYYVQDGGDLVCQNCGNRFTVDEVEIESGGCNPWPIFPEDKTVTEESVSISYDFLEAATRIFENWKADF